MLCWIALAGVARAEPDDAPATAEQLVWQAPAGCPDAEGVRARIARRLTVEQAAAVHGISVDIVRRRGEYVARVDLRGITVANDIRTRTAPSCSELSDAIAVIVARVAAEAFVPPKAAPTVARVAVTTTTPAITGYAEQPPVATARDWGGGVHAVALSGIGGVPEVGLGGEVAGFVRYRQTFVELGWAQWVAGDVMLRTNGAADLAVGLGTSVLRVGYGPERIPVRAWLGGELGTMQARGIAGVQSERWAAASAGLGVCWPISAHIHLLGSFEVLVPVARPRFTLVDGDEAYRVSALSNRAAIGLEVGWR